ncbi:slit homolog 1 protein-like [Branchiostoma floridae]|uniref:Slit homolog 1 protein-like n=1 Tax=Branchiostoma floridae TaxID=7739 RepID=A0A9J7HS14_BRAFL|nr:slit homolog 1 protein-like [Branchiostoma floridae]
MSDLVVLDLTAYGPLTLEPNGFKGLSRVQHTTITSKTDIFVRPRAFSAMVALQNLTIITDEWRVLRLPEQPFEGLLSIKTLTLKTGGCRAAGLMSSNVSQVTFYDIAHTVQHVSLTGIHVIGPAFAGCTNLSSVQWSKRSKDCRSQPGPNISPLAFQGAASLESITLHSISLQNIRGRMFAGLHHVVNVTIKFTDFSGIEYLPSDMFTGLSSVRNIWLDGNPELPGNIFHGLTSLREIRIENMVAHAMVNSSGKFCYSDFQHLFSGLQSLEVVRLTNSRIQCETLPTLTFSNLSSLKEVHLLETSPLKILPIGFFHDVPVLQTFTFSEWTIYPYTTQQVTLPPMLFTGLNMEVIDLSRQYFLNISRYLFQNLTSLQSLYMADCLFDEESVSAAENLFSGLASLQHLDISLQSRHETDSRFSTIPLMDNMLKDLVSLKTLKMAGSLSSAGGIPVPSLIFKGLRSLTVLHLENRISWWSPSAGEIVHLPQNIFDDLASLKYLNLENVAVQSLDKDIFKGLTNLRELYLTRTSLTQQGLSSLPFSNLKSLETLSMASVPLDELSPNLFVGAENLSVINLFDCRFSTIQSGTFRHLTNLTSLKIPKPQTIEKGAFDFENQINIQIDMAFPFSHFPLSYTSFPDDFINLFNNQTLMKMSSIQIDFIFGPYFYCDCKLTTLSVSYRRDKTLTRRIMPKVDNLSCIVNNAGASVVNNASINALRCPVSWPSCPKQCYCRTSTLFTEVFCSGRGFTSVPDHFPMDTALARLDVNAIQYVQPLAFESAAELLILNLSTNAIREINSSAFLGLRSLTELYLDGNEMSYVPTDLLRPIIHLRVLWLNNNNLLDLPTTLFHEQPISLRVLRLDHNNLTMLSMGIFSNLTSLTKLSLENNKFDCDCHLLWLKGWMLQRKGVIHKMKSVTCRSRGNAKDKYILKPIIELPDDAFICGDKSTYSSQAWVAAPGGLAILLFLILGVFKCRDNVRVWVYARYRKGLRHLEHEPQKTYDIYVSYCVEDEEFVDREVVRVLEDMDPPYKVCLRNRDFIPGHNNIQQATDSVTNSRRTLLVLTERFLQDRWCLWEFQVAHQQAVTDQAYRLIIVIMDDLQLEACDDIMDLKQYLKANKYLLWGELLFWDKVRQAVPPRDAQGEDDGEEGEGGGSDDNESDYEDNVSIFVQH